jgi:hypothetical protein
MGMSKPMVFDGIDNRVSTSSSSDFPVGDLSRTISAWICPTTYSTFSNIIGYGADTTSDLFAMCFSSGGNLGLWGSGDNYDSGLSISLNKWHHVVLTYDGTNIIGYVDGSKGATTAKSYNTTQSGFWIGYSAIYYDAFQGMINEVSVWNDDFTLAEVQELFNDGVPLDATLHSKAIPTGTGTDYLEGYWRNTGTGTWTDISQNSNDGTPAGSPDTILLPEGTTSGKDILGFPLTHTNNGWLNLPGTQTTAGNYGYVKVSDNDTLDGYDAMTWSFWLKPDKLVGNNFVADKRVTNQESWRILINNTDGDLILTVSGDGTTEESQLTTDLTLPLNTWTFVTMIFDSGTFTVYKNANSAIAIDAHFTSQTTIFNSTTPVYIGANADAARHWDGAIDEFRIYNRAISAPENLKNYKHGLSKHS